MNPKQLLKEVDALALAFNDAVGKRRPVPNVGVVMLAATKILVGGMLTHGVPLEVAIGDLRSMYEDEAKHFPVGKKPS